MGDLEVLNNSLRKQTKETIEKSIVALTTILEKVEPFLVDVGVSLADVYEKTKYNPYIFEKDKLPMPERYASFSAHDLLRTCVGDLAPPDYKKKAGLKELSQLEFIRDNLKKLKALGTVLVKPDDSIPKAKTENKTTLEKQTTTERFVDRNQLKGLLGGVSTGFINKLLVKEYIPAPIVVGNKELGWTEVEVNELINKLKSSRDKETVITK